jgi:hypothetical protein
MIEAVDQSLINYWDKSCNERIPDKLRAMAAAYAQFRGRDYGNWIQGKRALSRTLPVYVDIWKDMFRRLLK